MFFISDKITIPESDSEPDTEEVEASGNLFTENVFPFT